MKLNNEAAIKYSIQIVEKMIESTPSWIDPEVVIDSLEQLYNYFQTDAKPEQ